MKEEEEEENKKKFQTKKDGKDVAKEWTPKGEKLQMIEAKNNKLESKT